MHWACFFVSKSTFFCSSGTLNIAGWAASDKTGSTSSSSPGSIHTAAVTCHGQMRLLSESEEISTLS